MKKLLVIAIAAFAFTACNSSSKPAEGENHDTTATEQPAAPAEGTTMPAEGTAPAPAEGTTTAPAEGATSTPAEAAPAAPAEKH
jgi:hypothetical protein